MRRFSSLLVLGTLLLSACANDPDSDQDSGSADGADDETHPNCSAVWVEDGPIPDAYEGCIESDGSTYESDVLECDDSSILTTYATAEEGFYTDTSGRAVETEPDVASDPGYQERLANC